MIVEVAVMLRCKPQAARNWPRWIKGAMQVDGNKKKEFLCLSLRRNSNTRKARQGKATGGKGKSCGVGV